VRLLTSRLVYVGDSAALSFLQSIRRLVEGSLGASPFTTDPNRHKLVEASISTPPGYRHSCVLPDLETARYLTDSFFDNVSTLELPVSGNYSELAAVLTLY
jgi:hypothetical protein